MSEEIRCVGCVLANVLTTSKRLSIGTFRAKGPLSLKIHPEARKDILSDEVRKGNIRHVPDCAGVIEVALSREQFEDLRDFLKLRIEEDTNLLKEIDEFLMK